GYGIDFGTSNSSVSIAYADRVEVLTLAGSASRTLPSFVYLHRAGRRAAGDEAVKRFLVSGHEKTDCWNCRLAPYGWDTDCRQYRKGGGCNDARLLSGAKHELAKLSFACTHPGATHSSVGALASRHSAPRVAGIAGIAIGGETLDGILFETIVGPALGLDALPSWLFNELRTASSVRLLMADPGIPAILARIGGGAADVAN